MKTTRNFWRIVTLALALVMMFSVVACGNNADPEATTEAAGTDAPSTEAPTTATTEKPTTGTTAPTTQPTTGTTAPTTEPTTGTTGGTDDPVTPPVDDLTQPDVWDGTMDTSWFDKNDIKTEYVLTTAEQFAGFIKLRQDGYNKEGHFSGNTDRYYFEGVTIKLARDIILNEGTAEEIKEKVALGQARQVTALNSNAAFKGVFDGQGHTISGAFLDCTSSGVKALFGGIGENGVLKNVDFKNCYFNGAEKDKNRGAIVAARISGNNALLSNITITDCLLEEGGAAFSGVAFLLGAVNDGTSVTIENCHVVGGTINFANMGTNGSGFGSFIGYLESGTDETTDETTGVVTPATTTTVVMKNCTSNATIIAPDIIGGMIGVIGDRCDVKMDYKCKFTGTITVGEITNAETGATEPGRQGQYVGNDPDFLPTQPTIIPEFTGEDFSSLKFPEFENATIVIDGANCEVGSVMMTVDEAAGKFNLFNKDGNTGAAAHGVYKLSQDGVFHYYIDFKNVNSKIEKEYGAEYKIADVSDCYIRWTFTVTEAGTYTVGSYMRIKNNSDRKCQVQFDDQTPLIMHYTLTKEEANVENNVVLGTIQDATQGSYLMWDGVEVTLEAGEHTITYTFPEGSTESTSSWHWRTIYLMKKAA